MNFKNLQRVALSFFLLITWNYATSQCSATLSGGGQFCSGEVASVQIDFTGDGPWDLEYEIDGVPQPTINTLENPLVIDIVMPGGTIGLNSVSSPTCGSGTVSGEAVITYSDQITIGCTGTTFTSCGPFTLQCPVFGGTPPYLYSWSNGSTDPGPPIFASGDYSVTVTDALGCTAEASFTAIVTELACSVNVFGEISCSNPTITLEVNCGAGPNIIYNWIDATGDVISNEPFVTVSEPGIYTIELFDPDTDCSFVEDVLVEEGTEDCASIIGQVIVDDDGDCATTPGESGIGNWLVYAENTVTGDVFLSMTDVDGNYSISLLPGDYEMYVVNPSTAIWLPCETAVPVTIVSVGDVETIDFHIGKLIDCPLMQVDIGTPFVRRCFENTYTVHYCNLGTQVADEATVEVSLDPLLEVQSASIPWTGPVGNVYTFEVGDVGLGECGTFSITTLTSCDSELGQTLCATAHVYPDTLCDSSIPGWSGASLVLTYECDGDNLVFTITNVGLGTMDEPLAYIVIEDGVMMMEESDGPTLGPGESHTVTVPANGATYVLDVPQVANHPGNSAPLLAIEGCGVNGSGTFSTGFVNQFSENDGDNFISIDCHEVIGAYDPNDKRGFPLGFGANHLIELGQSLDYHIRFQNTGTDTAFNVRIVDVISEKLDLSTFRPGAASHSYEVEFLGADTVVFIFPNIMLPDSNVNEPLSHGFVKFEIQQSSENILGDEIENTAGIYFDFNEAVITNTTVHRIGEEFVPTPVFESLYPDVQMIAQPNPTTGETEFRLTGNVPEGRVTLTIFDSTGKAAGTRTFLSPIGKIDVSNLSNGLYFFQMNMEAGVIGNGKFLKQ